MSGREDSGWNVRQIKVDIFDEFKQVVTRSFQSSEFSMVKFCGALHCATKCDATPSFPIHLVLDETQRRRAFENCRGCVGPAFLTAGQGLAPSRRPTLWPTSPVKLIRCPCMVDHRYPCAPRPRNGMARLALERDVHTTARTMRHRGSTPPCLRLCDDDGARNQGGLRPVTPLPDHRDMGQVRFTSLIVVRSF